MKQRHFMDYVQNMHRHSMRHLKLWFVPHSANDHQPHALRPKALQVYSVILILAKIATSTLLFITYPNPGHFAALTSQTMINLTNTSRTQAGLKPLSMDKKLQQAAEAKARDMIKKGYFAHTNPAGDRFFTWIQKAGYNYSIAGENLAMDFTSAENTHEALMNSPTHKENILNKKYTNVGMAVLSGKVDGSDTIVLVEMFGAPYLAKTRVAAPVKPKTAQKTPAKSSTTTPTKQPAQGQQAVKSDTDVGNQPAIELAYGATLTDLSANTIETIENGPISFSATYMNSGSAPWSEKTVLNPVDNTKQILKETAVLEGKSIGRTIQPNDSITIPVDLTAPSVNGPISLGFILKDQGKEIPGSATAVDIIISAPKPLAFAGNKVLNEDQAVSSDLQLAKNEQNIQISPLEKKNDGFLAGIIEISRKFFFGFLIFLILTLLLNILIKIKIQHGHIIVEAVIVIALASVAYLVRLNFLESIGSTLKIL